MSNSSDTYMKNKSQYNGDYNSELLEQYLSYVESSKSVSKNRIKTNKFFVTLLSTLAVFVSFAQLLGSKSSTQTGLFLTSFLGLCFSIAWWANVKSYQQINSGKYEVIHDFEEKLPFQAYEKEWDYLDQGENWRTYLKHTTVEKAITYPLILVFFVFCVLYFPEEILRNLVS